jgi:hypothetical protein
MSKAAFFNKPLKIYAFISLFMATVVSGIFAIFNMGEKITLYYYGFYTIYNILFIVLVLIRIPYYRKEKNGHSDT